MEVCPLPPASGANAAPAPLLVHTRVRMRHNGQSRAPSGGVCLRCSQCTGGGDDPRLLVPHLMPHARTWVTAITLSDVSVELFTAGPLIYNTPDFTMASNMFYLRTFHFQPNADAAIAHGVAFALMACALMHINWRSGKTGGAPGASAPQPVPRYLHLLPVCALLEAVGYFVRVPAVTERNLMAYITQSFLILVVPIILALVQYITVGRLLRATGKRVWCVRPALLSRLFLASDILCFILQSGGSGMMTSPTMKAMGAANAIAGIVLQLIFYTAFAALVFTLAYGRDFKLAANPQLRPVFTGLLVTIGLIYARNVYRIAQFADTDTNGVFATSEFLFNGFETVAIFLAFAAFGYWHFGRLLPADDAGLTCMVAQGDGATGTTNSTVNSTGTFAPAARSPEVLLSRASEGTAEGVAMVAV